jgi:hypothetical protein
VLGARPVEAVEPVEPVELVEPAPAASFVVVGCTGVTRRGRVAPDCAEASPEASASAAQAAVSLKVCLVMGRKSFIRLGPFQPVAPKGEGAELRMPRAPGGFAAKKLLAAGLNVWQAVALPID